MNGYYYIYGLAPGDYKVQFSSSGSNYLREWFDNESSYETADPVSAPATNIDAHLEEGGRISGKVTSVSQPGGVNDVYVYVYDLSGNQVGHGWTRNNGSYDGYYETDVLPPGEYKVEFNPWQYNNYFSEWYNDKRDRDSADPVIITAGVDATGIDAELEEYGSISGQVTSATEPGGVQGVEVYLYGAGDPDNWIQRAVTSPGGGYQFIRVAPGDYKVCFSPVSGMNYAEEWYDNQPGFDSAGIITVLSGAHEGGKDADLEPGGSISGQVTSQSMPGGIEGVAVYAYTPEGEYARACLTDEEGRYMLTSLATGDYKVYFDTTGMPYKNEWYDDKHDLESATPVHVVTGVDTPGIDALLADSGSISGRVTSDREPGGVLGIYVHAYPEGDPWNWSGWAQTKGDGTYVIENLVPGKYKLIFNISSGQNYKSVWYDGKTSFGDATPVTVDERINTGNIDCHLSEYASVSGRVTNEEGEGVAGVWVQFHKVGEGQVDPAVTDQDGNYLRSGLDQGQYKLEFTPGWLSPYAREWYNDKTNQASADIISLSYGEKKENIKAVLSDDGAPKVYWVNPNEGMDTQSLNNVFIFGANFARDGSTPPRVLLYRESTGSVIEARDVNWIDSGSLTCGVNLIGQPAGKWDVMVVNPNGQAGRLVEGFEIIHKPRPPEIYGPATAASGDVPLHGKSEAGSVVEIYKRAEGGDWEYATRAFANEHGNWNTTVNLAAGAYELHAIATNGGMDSDPSTTISVVVGDKNQLAVLDGYKAVMFGDTYNPDPSTGVIYLPAFSGAPIDVKVKFSSLPDEMDFNFKKNDYPFSGPDAQGYYTASLTGWSWASGSAQGTLCFRDEGRDFQQVIMEVRLIDPSGFVYDAGTGENVQGARATLQYFFEGAWQNWPAGEYGQVNPQYTEDEGRYGWEVHPGKYRVVAEKASYQTTISREVEVTGPPGVTDLDIGIPRNAPIIDSISVSQGEAGTEVTITGSNFGNIQAGSSVIFFNEKKAPVSVWSDTSITCTVPGGALSGNVMVETASGRSNGVYFTVIIPGLPAPVINSIIPGQGEVGAPVTISGSNFGNNPGQVIFSVEKPAQISSWSDTSITCTVPQGAVSGNVVVETAAGRSNGVYFTVLPTAKKAQKGATWYLAEGCTQGGMETFILVQNPNDAPAQVTLTFMTSEGPKDGPSGTLAPNSRQTWKVNDFVTTWNVSTKVTSNQPVVAERAMYGGNRTWAHDSVGYCSEE